MKTEFERQTSFGWLLNVVANHASKEFDKRLREKGLTLALWPTLMCLWEKEGVTQREIAQMSKVESSTTTRTLDKLEALELVERRADPESRRSFRIFLTDKGKALKEEVIHLPVEVNQALLAGLEEEEQRTLIATLQKLVGRI
ncbi:MULTISPECIES: MarR family winged helix-turn-helix transcriptional regulator [Vibrio]|uniref:MarR family transcriptional regulator n=1 Tax=Vibrio mediterranei TaxID=689 RepID=A0AAN1KR29_9VIBR|nr:MULTISPECIES: MarR family transcriptional regulator [Vibrio]ASI93089.1 MarR family transcriptional regulator [Vibrio mediterranei]KFA98291.1 MarR family transcriptional regulator [Vibrio sp. ER1A]MCG9625549.1 MarR family transcriptional regulator [Vibrio mediterranei]MCY9874710.1 MarR family transcriptional regulator [Vibrio barjaei]NOH30636.1 MarR family transcriptional regulator [Vibrio mediterranei]